MLAHSSKSRFSRVLFRTSAAILPILAVVAGACSTASKKPTTPELSQMLGKKVALVDLEGDRLGREATEVALINQLTQRGSFDIIPKEDVEAARVQFQQDPTDWKGIARRAGADYALKARVLEFNSNVHTGYSREKVYDSLLKKETGHGETERLYKVKSLTGSVKVELQFANLKTGKTRIGIAEKKGIVYADERKGAAHLPPRLGFLEGLLEKAFHHFFVKYQ